MKKFYIIGAIFGAALILCISTLLINPNYITLISRRMPIGEITPSPAGDIMLLIVIGIFITAVAVMMIYKIYKAISGIFKKQKHNRTHTDISDMWL